MHPDLWSVKLETLLASVNWEANCESQVSSILNKVVEKSEVQSNKIETIKQDLEKVIHTVCPEAVLTVYGSANCGLSLVSSDVDFSLNIMYTEHIIDTVSLAIRRDKTFKQTESLKINFPVIRSIHAPSDTEFNLTFKNEGAIATTELLAHIMNLDPRVKQLTLLIKIWCKIHCLMSPKYLTSISWYMLVIFYLQQQGIVPSVSNMLDKTNQRYVNGYNVALHKKYIYVPRGNKHLIELLGDFFLFYSKLDWQKYAVCPFTARLIPKTDFSIRNHDNLPVEYKDYKKQINQSTIEYGRIIIQHALIHSRNCSYNIEECDFKYFCDKIHEVAVIYTENSNESFLRKILQSPEKPAIPALIKRDGMRWSISGFSASTTRQELVQLFSKYGKVEVENMDQGIAILEFKDQFNVWRLMSDNCILHGQQLQVKYFEHGVIHLKENERFARSNEKNTIISPSEIDLTGDFDRQLKSLLSAVSLTKQEVNDINQLYSDVENTLQPQWPGCKVIPFGSLTTGLGIKSSDADCYISGAWSGDRSEAAVNKAKQLLQQRRNLFAEILAITRANIPIVKLFHLPTQTNCDIGFKTPLGTHNSKLVAFLLQSDPKLIPISVVIKYWAKIHGLTGSGRMSNYALTMLVIFYLQQPPLNILPAVHCLQNTTNRQMVDGWNTGFAELLLQRDNKQQLTIPQLLAGFFEFYVKFDFNKYVVCPYWGRPIEKELFNKPDSLPEEFDIYKHNIKNGISLPLNVSSPMCVQDPFEQCRNVATTVSISSVAEIKAHFTLSGEMHNQNDHRDYLKNILLRNPKQKNLPVKSKQTSKELIFRKVLRRTFSSDWYHCLPYIFKVFLTMKLKIFNYKDKDDLVSITYTSNINREAWERCQRGRLSKASTKLLKRINAKFTQIGESDINLPVIIKIEANKDPKKLRVIFILEDHVNDDKEIINDFTTFSTVQIPIWLRYFQSNTDYVNSVALNGYQISPEDVVISDDYVCAVNNNINNVNRHITFISTGNQSSVKQNKSQNISKKKKNKKKNQNNPFACGQSGNNQIQNKKVIEIKFKKVLKEIIGTNWYDAARLILDCIFNELLNMDLKKMDSKETAELISGDTYCTIINRDVWERCQSMNIKKLAYISDGYIDFPITVYIDLIGKNGQRWCKVTINRNENYDYNAIVKVFNVFVTESFTKVFRNLVRLYNTNNFNDVNNRKAVTLNL